MSKFLVTGGHGLIGSHVVKLLQQRDEEVVVIDAHTTYGLISRSEVDYLIGERQKMLQPHKSLHMDIVNEIAVDKAFATHKPNTVIHLASFPRQKAVNADPARAADVMIRGLVNMLESAVAHGVERFVFASSSMVYGDFENDVLEDDDCVPQGQYGILKLAGEQLVKDYARRYNMEYVIIRPSAVYGPLDVADRVIAKFMLTAMRGGQLEVNGPDETLDFTYVEDCAAGIVSASTRIMARNNTYNITKSHSVTLQQAAEMVVDIVGRGSIDVRDKDADFPSRGALNIDRARTILGYDPKVDVEEGFREYYKWLSTSEYWKCQLQQV